MGSYCQLYLNGYEIDSSKSYINGFYSLLFRESDKRSRMVNYDDYYTEPIYETDLVPTYEYAATAATIKPRLELLGYTLEDAIRIYETGLEDLIAHYKQNLEQYNHGYEARHIRHFNTLRENGFSFWTQMLRRIFNSEISLYQLDNSRDREKDTLEMFVLDLYGGEAWLGFPNLTIGYFLRAALEAVDDEDELILDITSLVSGGYYGEDEAVCEGTAQANINGTRTFQKIILMTEGKSDAEFLSRTLRLLHPEINSYFSFLEFDAVKADGGSAALERNIKAFASAGISNFVIGIFDNDAAGLAAFDRLKKIAFPVNIQVLTLPDLPIARSYPTNGPQGTTFENINGRACSIEMYFGEDVLKQNDSYSPVHWKGFEEKIKQYQGELIEKSELQEKFRQKLRMAEQNGINDLQDWTAMRLIFAEIIKAVSFRQKFFIGTSSDD